MLFGTAFITALSGCMDYYETISVGQIPEAKPSIQKVGQAPEFCDKKISEMDLEEVQSCFPTPIEAQAFLCDYIQKNNPVHSKDGNKAYSLKEVLEGAPATCKEGTFAVAAALEQYGYPPIAVILGRYTGNFIYDIKGHMVFVYKLDGKFGSAGYSYSDFFGKVNGDWTIEAEFETFDELILGLAKEMEIYVGLQPTHYEIINIKDNYPGFVDGKDLPMKNLKFEKEIRY